MRNIILTIFLILGSFSYLLAASVSKKDALFKQLDGLDKQQLEVLVKSYIFGEKEGFAYELVTIAWKESYFGKYPMNLDDGKYGSFGPYHVLLENSMRRHNMRGSWNKSRLAEKHVTDIEFSASDALYIWNMFYTRTAKLPNREYRTFAMYNAGVAGIKNNAGKKYADDAIFRMNVLKEWMSKNNIISRLIEPAKNVLNKGLDNTKQYRDLKQLRKPVIKE